MQDVASMQADMAWQMNEFRRAELGGGDALPGTKLPAGPLPASRAVLLGGLTSVSPAEIRDNVVYCKRAAANGTTFEAERQRDQTQATRKPVKVGRGLRGGAGDG